MQIKKHRGSDLIWESLDHQGESWFNSTIALYDFSALKTTDEEKSKHIQKLLKNSVRLNSEFLSKWNGFKVETQLEFPLDWGLGSSSTLIDLMAQWAKVNALMLSFRVSNGSGYDVACASADGPLLYQITDDTVSYTKVDWNPKFTNQLYFVHLGTKQKSDDQIKYYTKKVKKKKDLASKLSDITDQIVDTKSLSSFEALINEHEQILAKALEYDTAKSLHFADFWGSIKSLGAWGGDFVLASSSKSEEETKAYFAEKNFATVIPYADMMLA